MAEVTVVSVTAAKEELPGKTFLPRHVAVWIARQVFAVL
jgi:hypothetical protein